MNLHANAFPRPARLRCRTFGAAIVLLAFGTTRAGAAGGERGAVDLASPRETLERWVETRRVISEESTEWEVARQVLEQRIELVSRETASLDERTRDLAKELSVAGDREAELAREKAALRAITQALAGEIDSLEARARTLLSTFPDPLMRRVEPLARRLQAGGDAEEHGVTMAQRYQSIVGILNEAGKFARDVTLVNEVRELPGGQRAEVRVLYLGLGQAWYVSADGRAAGLGVPGADGWTWTSRDDAAPDIARAMAILKDEEIPAHVQLPVIVR